MAKEATGDTFAILSVRVDQNRFSQEKAKTFLTAEQFESCKVESSYEKLQCTRIKGTKPAFEMPKLDNYTKQGLADELGDVREKIKNLEKLEGIYAEALKGRWRQEAIEAEDIKRKEAAAAATATKAGKKK